MKSPTGRSSRRHRRASQALRSQTMRRTILAGSILSALGLAITARAAAPNLFWDPSQTSSATIGGSGVWDAGTTPDWFNGSADVVWPNDGSLAIFGGNAGAVSVSGAVNAGGLLFTTSGYTLLDGGTGSINLTTAGPGGAGLAFPAITVMGSGASATISVQLTGTSGLAKLGDGTLFLTNSSDSYTGDTIINAGALVITDEHQLGASTTAISINGIAGTGNPGFSGGQLILNGGVTGTGFTLTREVSISGRGPGAVNSSGGLVSIGNNTLAGHVVLGGTSSLGAIVATPGITTISGNLQIGTSGNASVLYGNGNYAVSGQVTGYDIATDRFVKSGQILATTLWLQNATNNFAESLRIDSGTVRVSTNGALGTNTSTQAVDLNNGTLEIRTDSLGSGAADFSTRKIFVRDNTTGTVFVGGDLLGSAINQTGTFGETRITGGNTSFNLTGRDGFNATFTGLNNSPTSALGVGGAGPATISNNSNGLLTLAGTSFWNQTDTTARLLTIQGNADTLLTGSIIASGNFHTFTKAGSGQLTIQGTASTFTGNASVNAGTLTISSIGALNAAAGSGRVVFGGGALNYIGSGETWTNKGLTLNATNNILTNNGTGGLILPQNVANNGTGLKNLVLGGANTSTNDLQGIITNTTVGTGVIKLDGGNWQISTPGTTAASIGTANPTFAITAVGTTASATITTTSTANLVVGQPVSGTGIPFGTVITQIVSPTQFTISQNATSTGSSVVLGTVTGTTAALNVTANTGNLLTVGSTANLVPGQTISGTGLPAGAIWYVSAINSATTFTVANTTAVAALANNAAVGSQTPGVSSSFGGALTITGGTVTLNSTSPTAEVINNSASVIFAADPIRANGYAGGTLNYQAYSSGSTETAGVLSVTAGAGTVQITPTAGTNALTFGSLLAPSLGTGLNFVVPASPGTNSVSLIAAPAVGLLNAHAYYNGADFVYNPATANSVLRAPVYGTDAGFAAVNTLTAGNNVAIDTTATSGALAVTSLKISGSPTLNLTGTLTVGGATGGGLLLTGGSGGLGQGTGGAVTTNSAGDLAIRVNGASDVFTLAVPITSTTTGGLTKNGLGTLVLSAVNAETGTVTINEGTIKLSGTGTLGATNIGLLLRQNTALDLNGVSPLTPGALNGAGTITNSAASGTATLQFGNGNAGSFFSGTIQDGAAAKVALTKVGTGTIAFQGTNTYTGPTQINAGNLDVTLLADIGSPSGIGKGDATSAATNAASLVFNGGSLRYVGTNATAAITVTQSPSVSINRLFTMNGNGAIASYGSYGNDIATRAANNATVIFNNTGDLAFSGATGLRTLTLQGDSAGDNEMRVHLVDNNTPSTGFNVLGITKADAGLWILNPVTPNTYTGSTIIQRGALQANDGAGLSAGSLVNFNDTTGGVLQTSGTFARTVGTTPGKIQWTATGSGGFAASSSKLTVNLGPQTWGNRAVGFLGAGNLILSSTTALADVEYTGDIDFGGGNSVNLSITNAAASNALTVTTGTTAGLQLGQTIAAPNIPVGSIVTGITDGTHFTINNNATAGNTAAAATASVVASGTATSLAVTTVSGSPTLTVTSGVTDGIVPGQPITGTNIPANSYVLAVIDSTTFTLNQNATTSASNNYTTTTPVAGRTVQVDDNGTTGLDFATLSGVLSGYGGLSKTGGGTLILGDSNTYNGATALQNGSLVVTSIGSSGAFSSSLGSNGNSTPLVMGSGGNAVNLLYVGSGETTTRPISLTGTTGTETIDSSGAGALILTNVVNNVGPNAFTFQLRGTNTAGNMITSQLGQSGANAMTLTKADGGVWILNPSAANTFTGNINANGGLLGLTAAGIGSAANLALSNGGVFAYGGDLTSSTNVILSNNATAVFAGSNNLTFNGTLTKAVGANDQTISNNLDAGKALTFNGNFIDAETGASTTRTINLRGYGATVFNGLIQNNSGASNLLKLDIRLADSGSVTLGGNNAGASLGFTGGILLGQGTLIVANAGALGPAANAVVLDGGYFQSSLATGDLTGANRVLNKVSLQGDQVTLTGSQSIELAGIVDTAGGNRFLRNELTGGASLTISGPVNLTSDSTARTLTLRGSAPSTITGVIANGVTAGSGLAYSGLSTLTLTGANTATGALTVNRNTVILGGAGANGGAWNLGTVTLNPTGILRLDNSAGNDTATTGGTAGRLSDSLIFTGQGGTLDIIGALTGTAETVGPLTLNSVQTFVTLTDNSGGAGNTLTFASVSFANSGSSLNLTGVPTLGTTNKVKITTALTSPAIVNNILPRVFIAGGTFATYDTTNGVQAFTGYNPTSATNINLAAVTDTVDANAAMTTASLTASRTINALRLNGSGISVGGANRTLTLTSGALLNTGGDNSLDVGAVNFTNTAFIQVATGTTLSVNSALLGSQNLSKALPGTLLLNTPSFVTGTHNVLAGTLKLNGGLNTLFPTQLINIQTNGTLDLNGNTQYAGQLSDPGTLPTTGGSLISSAGSGTIVSNMAVGSTTFASTITGNVNFGRVGGNTLTFESINSYTGATSLLGGTLQLQDDATILNTSSILLSNATLLLNNNSSLQRAVYDRVGDTTPITLRTGTINFTGKVSDPSTETFGAVTAAEGANTVTVTLAGVGTAGAFTSSDVTFASLTRAAGATVNFTGTNLGSEGNNSRLRITAPLTTFNGGVLGAWAIANSTDYAAYNAVNGVGVVGNGGFAGYDATFGTGKNTNLGTLATIPMTTTLALPKTSTALLKLSGNFTNNVAFATGSEVLNLELGGILRSNNAFDTSFGTAAKRGTITAGGTETSGPAGGVRELVIYNAATGNPSFGSATINPTTNIVTLGSTQGLQAGLTVTNGNFPAGTTVLSVDSLTQVTLSQTSTNATQQTSQTLTGGSFVNGVTTLNSAVVTTNSTIGIVPGMTITGSNVPAGTYVVSVDSPTQLTLSQASTAAGTAIGFTLGVSNLIVNSVIADNGAGNSVSLVKSGAGVLSLSANNLYTGGTVVNQGTLNLIGSGVVIPKNTTTGLTINNGTVTMLTNAGQIDPANRVTLNGSSTLTLALTGNNTLKGLTFNNNGGTTNPTVNISTGTILTLSDSAPVTVTSANASTLPTISGGTLALGAGTQTFDIQGPTIQTYDATTATAGSSLYTKINAALNIGSVITGTGAITKSNTGILQLSAQNTFNGLNLTGGGILISGNSTPTTGGSTGALTSGPLGLGSVSAAAGTEFLVDGSRTIGNNVTFAGNPIFDSTANTVWTLALNGSIGLPAGAVNVQVINPNLTVNLMGAISNIAAVTSIIRTGAGTLNFNSTGYTGNFTVSGLGASTALSLFNDGNGYGDPQTVALGAVIFDSGVIPNLTVGRAGGALPLSLAANKILAPSSVNNLGLGLTVTNNNGYGLSVPDSVTIASGANYNVANATASNVVQGLYLTGVLSGTTGLTKSGAGTLVLGNNGNNFSGTLNVTQGVLSFGNDSQLGATSNVVALNPTTGTTPTSTLRATGTFTSGRTIQFTTAANTRAIEVTAGNTLTLTAPFDLNSNSTASLTKNDNGVLELATAEPSTWTGGITINAGAVRLSNSAALGSTANAVTVANNGISAALQLNGVNIPNAITLTSAGGGAVGGINSGGQIESYFGTTNSWSGLITFSQDVGLGADSGSTLNLTGGINQGGHILTFAGAGNINVATAAITNVYGITKIGTGTTTILVNVAAGSNNGPIVNAGTLTFAGASGALAVGTKATTVNPGGTLTVDDTITPVANRLGGNLLTLAGGNLNYFGNASANSAESIGAPSFNRGYSVVTVTAQPGRQADLTFTGSANGTGQNQNSAPTGATVLFRGTNLGAAAGAGTATIKDTGATSGFTFVGQTGATGSVNKGLLSWALVDSSATGNGTSFATGDSTSTFTTSVLRPLAANEYQAANTVAANNNINLTSGVTSAGAANLSINSLTMDAGAGLTVGNLLTLTNLSGGVLVKSGSSTISGGVLSQPSSGSGLTVWTLGDLTISSTLTGGNGITNGSAGLVKAGAGTLTLSTPATTVPGLSTSANTYSGLVALNQGTLKLNGGRNTLQANNYLEVGFGSTLDLNGTSQQVYGFFSDGAVDGAGGTVTSSAGAGNLVVNLDNAARNWAGSIAGGAVASGNYVSFTRSGQNTLSFYSANPYSGTTLINGGALTLRDMGSLSGTSAIDINYATLAADNNVGTVNLTDRINDAAAITLRGGTLTVQGRAQTASFETLGAISFAQGYDVINPLVGGTGVNSIDVSLGGFSRPAGSAATVIVQGTNLGTLGSNSRVTTSSLNGVATGVANPGAGLINNIVGGWAENGNDFLTYSPVLGFAVLGQTGALQYDFTNTFVGVGPTKNVRLTGTTTVPAGGATVYALSMSGSNIALPFTAATDTLNIVSGGLIGPNNNQAIGTTALPGKLTAGGLTPGAASDLYIFNRTNTLTINSSIVDNANGTGSAVRAVFTASGGAITLVNPANSYTGGTVVNGGTLNLTNTAATAVIPLAADPTSGLVLNGATVTMNNFAGQIAAGNVLTLNGSSTANLFASNTLAGLVFNNNGGTSAPTVNTFTNSATPSLSSSGILTIGSAGIVATSSNVGTTSTIVGRVDFGAAANTISVDTINANGTNDVAPLQAGFALQGVVGSGGGITKTGAGVLGLAAQEIFTGALHVANGALRINAVSGGSRFSALTLDAGTRLDLGGFSTTVGSLAGAGSVFNSGGAGTLTAGFDGTNSSFAGTFNRFSDAVLNAVSLTKVGVGTLTLTGAATSSTSTGALTVNRGTLSFKDAGTNSFTTSAITVNEGATLTLDDSGSSNLTNRLSNTALTVNGGTLNLVGAAGAATAETSTATLTLGGSASAIALTPGAGGTLTMTFGSLSQGANGTANITGTNLGTDSKLLFTSAPGLSNGILARYAVNNTDFATYAAGTGLTAYTGYVTPTDLNTATSTQTIKVDSTTTTTALTAIRTVNALDVVASNVTIGAPASFLPTQGLTVGTGGVLINGNNATISTPALTLGAEGIFRINGTSLTVNSSITGSAGITKTGAGSLLLNARQSYTGTTTQNIGNITLGGGSNTIAVVPTATTPTVSNLIVNGGTFDLNGNNQAIGTISNNNVLAFLDGTITNSSATPALLTSVAAGNSSFGGTIGGNLAFTKSGNNTLTLADVQTYTGATIIRGGNLTLQDKGALYSGIALTNASVTLNYSTLNWNNANYNTLADLNPTRLPAAVPVTLQGGVLTVNGGGSLDTVISLNTLNVTGGGNTVNILPFINEGSTVKLTVGNLVRNPTNHSFVNFNGYSQNNSGGTSTIAGQGLSVNGQLILNQINGTPFSSTNLVNNLIGGWAVVDGSAFATYVDGAGVTGLGTTISGIAAPGYTGTDITAATVASGNYNDGTAHTVIGAHVANTWRIAFGASATDTLAAATPVTLGTGIITNTNVTTTIAGTDATSTIAGSGTDLYVFTNQATTNLNVKITGGASLVKAGGAVLGLGPIGGSNDYTGGTYVQGGTLNLNAAAGVVAIPGDLTINNSTVTMVTNAGQIAPAANIFVNGGGLLTTVGSNTLTSVTFKNDGGNGTPTVNGATALTLSSLTPITSSNDSLSFTPTISGTALSFTTAANALVAINTSGLSPDDLVISAPITGTGTAAAALNKTGPGSLVLGTANTFNASTNTAGTGVLLTDGTLILNNAAALGNVANTLTIGDSNTANTVPLTLLAGSAALTTAANPVVVNRDFTFGGVAASNSLNLAGTVNLGAVNRTISVSGLLVTGTLSGVVTSTSTDTALTKAGPGTLLLSNAGDSFGTAGVVVSGGVLKAGVANLVGNASLLTVSAGAFYDLGGFGQISKQIAGGGTIFNSGAAATFLVGGTTATDTTTNLNSSIGGFGATTPANLLVTKSGVGSLTVTGAGGSTQAGATTVVSGSLIGGAVNAFSPVSVITVGNATTSTAGLTATFDIGAFNQTVGGLVASPATAAGTAAIVIGAGRTLTVNGPVTLGSNVGANDVTNVNFTGTGNLVVNNTGGTFLVGGATGTNADSVAANLSALTSFTANLGTGGTFRVGDNNGTNGGAGSGVSTLTLATNNTINAGTLAIGDTQNVTNALSLLKLGSGVNTINANTITVSSNPTGGGRGNGTLNFATGTGTLTVRAFDGVSAAALNIVNAGVTGTGTNLVGIVDLTGHSSDLLLSALTLANRSSGNTGSGPGTATFSFDTGTLTTGSLSLSSRSGTDTTGQLTSTVNIGGGIVNLGAVTVGVNTAAAATGGSTGTLNVTGGTVSISSLSLSGANGTGAVSTGTLSLTGGTVTLGGDISRATTAGTQNTTLTLNGATLDLGGNNIGSLAGPVGSGSGSLAFQSGTLKSVNSINGNGGLTKTTAGLLIVDGTNNFSGPTVISAGTLQLGNGSTTGTLNPASTITDNANLVFNHSNTVTQGVDFAAGISGTGTLTQAGSGTLVLSGTNTYAGVTNVQRGTLDLRGSISGQLAIYSNANLDVTHLAASTVSLGSTQALTTVGSTAGTITGSLVTTSSVSANGAGAVGVLAVTGTTTLNAGASLNVDIAGSSADLLSTPALTLDTTGAGVALNLSLTSNVPFGSLFVIANTTSATTGFFAGSTPTSFGDTFGGMTTSNENLNTFTASNGEMFAISYTSNGTSFEANGGTQIALLAVPEPSAAGSLLTGLAALAGLQRFRRRRA